MEGGGLRGANQPKHSNLPCDAPVSRSYKPKKIIFIIKLHFCQTEIKKPINKNFPIKYRTQNCSWSMKKAHNF